MQFAAMGLIMSAARQLGPCTEPLCSTAVIQALYRHGRLSALLQPVSSTKPVSTPEPVSSPPGCQLSSCQSALLSLSDRLPPVSSTEPDSTPPPVSSPAACQLSCRLSALLMPVSSPVASQLY